MADEGAGKKVRKEREPITFTCLIVLLVAIILTTGSYAYGELFSSGDSTVVTDSSTVSTDYTLSFYNYYDQGGAIYQTTMSSVDDEHDKEGGAYIFCDNYSFSDSRYSVSMSGTSVLTGFKNALLGHKAGDTVTVAIKASEGYTNPVNYGTTTLSGLSMDLCIEMTSSDFNTAYGFTPTGITNLSDDDTGYGWSASVFINNDGMIKIQYIVEAGKEYEHTYEGMTITYKVTSVTSTTITYDVILPEGGIDASVIGDDGNLTSTFEHDGTVYTATKMVQVTLSGTHTVYIVGYDADGNYLYKDTTDETYWADLYFTIKIVSIS